MARNVGETYACEKCGSELKYTKPCPCKGMPHVEICCGQQMKKIADGEARDKS